MFQGRSPGELWVIRAQKCHSSPPECWAKLWLTTVMCVTVIIQPVVMCHSRASVCSISPNLTTGHSSPSGVVSGPALPARTPLGREKRKRDSLAPLQLCPLFLECPPTPASRWLSQSLLSPLLGVPQGALSLDITSPCFIIQRAPFLFADLDAKPLWAGNGGHPAPSCTP